MASCSANLALARSGALCSASTASPTQQGGGNASWPRAAVPSPLHVRRARRGGGATRLQCSAHHIPSRLVGTGSSVPQQTLTNRDLEKLVETSDDWISSRTGIRERHVMTPDQNLTDFAVEASRQALEMAGVSAEEVDLILLATSSPDDSFGGACLVQGALGATNAAAFDVTAACSGFVVGMITAHNYIQSGQFKTVLVVGADAMSRLVDWNDRNTCILFGDGAGAAVLQAGEEGATIDGEQVGVLGFKLRSRGADNGKLTTCYSSGKLESASSALGGSFEISQGAYDPLHMNGSEVFKFAVRAVPEILTAAAENAGVEMANVDHFVLHQANQRILDAASDRLGVDKAKVASNLARYGNTSAASIPLALDETVRSGKVKPGHLIGMAGFGAGLTWGGIFVRWG